MADAELAAQGQAVDPEPLPEPATDIVEYRGFVIHVFCHALGAGRFQAVCDIWDSGAVALEGGSPPSTYPTPAEARGGHCLGAPVDPAQWLTCRAPGDARLYR
ncbi:hypothetical protein ACTMU2_30385 [Cupriavidus basilensis]